MHEAETVTSARLVYYTSTARVDVHLIVFFMHLIVQRSAPTWRSRTLRARAATRASSTRTRWPSGTTATRSSW